MVIEVRRQYHARTPDAADCSYSGLVWRYDGETQTCCTSGGAVPDGFQAGLLEGYLDGVPVDPATLAAAIIAIGLRRP